MDVKSSVVAHATIMGSSTCERVVECPGSVRLVAVSPKLPPSQAAEDGTAQHGLVEHVLLNGVDPKDYLGTPISGVEMTREMIANVEIARNSAETLLAKYTGHQMIEQRVVHTPVEVFGTADIFAVSADRKSALIADHKFGYVEVSPSSMQNLFIAATAIEDFTVSDDGPPLGEVLANVETFELAIIQPSFDPAETVKTVTRDEVRAFRKRMEVALSQAKGANAPINIGSWCTYCPAKLICPAWQERGNDLIDASKHAEEWSKNNIAVLLDVYDKVGKLVAAAKDRAKFELEHGRKIEGERDGKRIAWKLKPGATRQAWTDPAHVMLPELVEIGFEYDDIVDIISPAALKKSPLYKTLPEDDQKWIEDGITKSQNEPSLARDTEPGAPALPAAAFARAAETVKHAKGKGK